MTPPTSSRPEPDWSCERAALRRGFGSVAGLDEAGRGALAGPVVAGAVVLDPGRCPPGMRDSKLLSPSARERLYIEITGSALSWGVGIAEAREIDEANVLVATRRAMLRALCALDPPADYLIVDAVAIPEAGLPFEARAKADRDVMSVAAASIVAKVTRDRILIEMDLRHPGYGFASHKGYGTAEHVAALRRLGPSAVHRRTFAPVSSPRLFDDVPSWPIADGRTYDGDQ